MASYYEKKTVKYTGMHDRKYAIIGKERQQLESVRGTVTKIQQGRWQV